MRQSALDPPASDPHVAVGTARGEIARPMDPAVDLVRAYLHVNGYFTVTEYPVLEATRAGDFRSLTDLDVLGFRFPGAGRSLSDHGPGGERFAGFEPDPALGVPTDRADMLVGEVKEGPAELNRGARDPAVLRAALSRFGCCGPDAVEGAIGSLHETGRASLGDHDVRLVAFGGEPQEPPEGYHVVTMEHVVGYLRDYLREYWDVLRHAESKDPALGMLVAIQKAERES